MGARCRGIELARETAEQRVVGIGRHPSADLLFSKPYGQLGGISPELVAGGFEGSGDLLLGVGLDLRDIGGCGFGGEGSGREKERERGGAKECAHAALRRRMVSAIWSASRSLSPASVALAVSTSAASSARAAWIMESARWRASFNCAAVRS